MTFFLSLLTQLMRQIIAGSRERLIHTLPLLLLWESSRVREGAEWVSMYSRVAQMFRIYFQREHRPKKKHMRAHWALFRFSNPRLHCSVHCSKIFSLMSKHLSVSAFCSDYGSDWRKNDCRTIFQPQVEVLYWCKQSTRARSQSSEAPHGPMRC